MTEARSVWIVPARLPTTGLLLMSDVSVEGRVRGMVCAGRSPPSGVTTTLPPLRAALPVMLAPPALAAAQELAELNLRTIPATTLFSTEPTPGRPPRLSEMPPDPVPSTGHGPAELPAPSVWPLDSSPA